MRIMKELDKEAARGVKKEMKDILKPVIDQAKSLVPKVALSHWQKYGWNRRGNRDDVIKWNPSSVKAGYRMTIGAMKRSGTTKYRGVAIMRNANAGAAIFELAGIKSTSADSSFVLGLEHSGHPPAGKYGRLLHAVWYNMTASQKHAYEMQIAAMFKRIEAQTQALLNKELG